MTMKLYKVALYFLIATNAGLFIDGLIESWGQLKAEIQKTSPNQLHLGLERIILYWVVGSLVFLAVLWGVKVLRKGFFKPSLRESVNTILLSIVGFPIFIAEWLTVDYSSWAHPNWMNAELFLISVVIVLRLVTRLQNFMRLYEIQTEVK